MGEACAVFACMRYLIGCPPNLYKVTPPELYRLAIPTSAALQALIPLPEELRPWFFLDIYSSSTYHGYIDNLYVTGGVNMAIDKSLLTGTTTMLILKLLEEADMYGYQMIEELNRKSKNVFELKAGTLYPLLHTLEQKELVTSYEKTADNARVRKYYRLTKKGRQYLREKKKEWKAYTSAVNNVLGGATFATV